MDVFDNNRSRGPERSQPSLSDVFESARTGSLPVPAPEEDDDSAYSDAPARCAVLSSVVCTGGRVCGVTKLALRSLCSHMSFMHVDAQTRLHELHDPVTHVQAVAVRQSLKGPSPASNIINLFPGEQSSRFCMLPSSCRRNHGSERSSEDGLASGGTSLDYGSHDRNELFKGARAVGPDGKPRARTAAEIKAAYGHRRCIICSPLVFGVSACRVRVLGDFGGEV